MVDKRIDEDSRRYASVVKNDEIIRILRSTTVGDKKADSLLWQRLNKKRFSSVVELDRSVLATQASSVDIQSVFSIYRDVLRANRLALSDEAVLLGIHLRS